VLFVCYDNGAYMNTGVQRSAATPAFARTATTPALDGVLGNGSGHGKDMARIAMAHRIPYAATATVADLRDLEAKVRTAMGVRGARYLHVLVPCPLGWGTPAGDTIRIARLATQSGLFPVFEAVDGAITAVTPIRQPADVRDYLKAQSRYRHLFEPEPQTAVLDAIAAQAQRNIEEFGLLNRPDAQEARTP
jgi:pyruvate ferredoxin oxidoreductase beta subunit